MKREEVQSIIPGITDEQLKQIMELHGADVERQKQSIATLTAERDTARTQLGEANEKLTGYDPDWKQKAAEAERKAGEQIAALKGEYAAATAAAGVQFTSESARRAFLADLKAKGLPLENDKLLGFDDFLSAYKQADPSAFAVSAGYPNIKDGGDPTHKSTGSTREQFAAWFAQATK